MQSAEQTQATGGAVEWLVTRTLYDDSGREILYTDPFLVADWDDAGVAVHATQIVYDDLGRQSRVERREGVVIDLSLEAVRSDGFDQYTTSLANAGTVVTDTEYFYDDEERVHIIRDATGLHTRYTYDLLDQVTTTEVDSVDTFDSPNLRVTQAEYDPVGRLIRSIDPLGRSTWYEYDDVGRQTAVITEDVVDPETGLTLFGRTETTYDDRGFVEFVETGLRQTNPRDTSTILDVDPVTGNGLSTRVTTHEYDRFGRLTEIRLPWVQAVGHSGQPVYHYTYDDFGGLASITDPLNRTTEFTFDSAGRQTSRTLPLGVETPLDPNDFVERDIYKTDASVEPDLVYGQLRESTDFEGRRQVFTYDNSPGAGGRRKQIDVYDVDSNPGEPDEQIIFGYDAFGRQIEATRKLRQPNGTYADDRIETWAYTDEGYLERVTQTQIGSPNIVDTIRYEYDDLGRLIRTYTGGDATTGSDPNRVGIDNDGVAVTDTRYTYDVFGRLETVSLHSAFDQAPAGGTAVTIYRYDLVGRIDGIDLPEDVVVDYVYDDLDRLTDLVHFVDLGDDSSTLDWIDTDADGIWEAADDGDDRPLAIFHYDYNTFGERIHADERFVNSSGGGSLQQTDWVYDALGRLVRETFLETDGTSTLAHQATDYIFDLVGNRIRVIHDHNLDPNDPSPHEVAEDYLTDYGYDANDRLLSEASDRTNSNLNARYYIEYFYGPNDSGTQLTKSVKYNGTLDDTAEQLNQTTLTYDAWGRQSTHTTQAFTQITSGVYSPSGSAIIETQRYSIGGDRVELTESLDTYRFVIDSNNPTGYSQVLESSKTGGVAHQRTFTLGHDVLTQTEFVGSTTTPKHFLYDAHGSTRALIPTANFGALFIGTQAATYDAYGNAITGTIGTAETRHLYSGEWTNKSGQQYLRARQYSPLTGRFTTTDPFAGNSADPQSYHKYLYAHGDPVNGVDPSGRERLVTQEEGDAIHAIIQGIYRGQHLLDHVLLGQRTQLGNPGEPEWNYKPDIFNITQRHFGEIKPNTYSGRRDGAKQVEKYVKTYESYWFTALADWPDVPVVFEFKRDTWIFFASPTVDGLILYDKKDALERRSRIPEAVLTLLAVGIVASAVKQPSGQVIVRSSASAGQAAVSSTLRSVYASQRVLSTTATTATQMSGAARAADQARFQGGFALTVTITITLGF